MSKNKAILELLQHDSTMYNVLESKKHAQRLGKLKQFLEQHKSANQWQISIAALEDALRSGLKPTDEMICEAITKCGIKGKLEVSKNLYTTFYKNLGRPRPLESHVAFMGACAACGDFKEAMKQFDLLFHRDKAMLEKNKNHIPIVNDDLMTEYLRSALASHIRQTTGGDTLTPPWQLALENFLAVRKESGLKPHVPLTPLLLESASQLAECGGQWELNLKIIETAAAQQAVIPPEAYDAAIRCCYHHRRHREVVVLMNELIATRTAPEERSVRLALTSCEEVGAIEKAESVLQPQGWITALLLFRAMKDNGLPLFQQNYEAPLRSCAMAGKWKEALAVLQSMKRDHRPVSLPLYHFVLASRIESASTREELEKFTSLPVVRDGEGSTVLYLAILRNCMKREDWSMFDTIDKEMKNRDIPETFEKMLLLVEAAYHRKLYHTVLRRFSRFVSITRHEKKRTQEWGTVRLYKDDFIAPERILDMVIDAYPQIKGKKDHDIEVAYESAIKQKSKRENSSFEALPLSPFTNTHTSPPDWMFSQDVREARSSSPYV